MEEKEIKHTGSDHHSHHHHRHHHHRHRKRKWSKTKFRRFLSENKKPLTAIPVALAVLTVLMIWGIISDNTDDTPIKYTPTTEPTASTSQSIPDSVVLELGYYPDELPLTEGWVTSAVKASSSISMDTVLASYRQDNWRLDTGTAVEILFNVVSLPEFRSIQAITVEVSESPDFDTCRTFSLTPDQRSVNVYLLKTGTQYYYRVNLTLSDDSLVMGQSSFRTATGPRILSIDGAVNVRDIGGWITTSGRPIRQGMIYRGSELDGAASTYTLTDQGLQDMLTVLGIRTDMDLRAADVADTDALGANVAHNIYNGPMYDQIFTDSGKATMRKVFADLADPGNYPIYLHCTHGMDRTGTVCYLLEALLGVDEEYLIREYELSALYYQNMDNSLLENMIATLETYGGQTMQENVEMYLLSIGVTQEEITNLRTYLLG